MKISLISIRLNQCLAIACLLLCSQCVMVKGDNQRNNLDMVGEIKTIEKLTDKEREYLLQQVGQQRQQLQAVLLSKLDSGNGDVKFYSAYLLGENRFSQSAERLAQNITLEDKVRSTGQSGRMWFWDRYPAVEALIKIGNPAIPAVIRNLQESDDAKIRELSLEVIYFIEKDRDIVQLRLQKALGAQKDPKKITRLQAAQAAFEKTPYGK